ncbi:type I restriction endonuclease subunit S [Vibrio sp. 03-59-1]|uniref:restriction endonuclease subunit S n=1 Tax=Vibrio sp. 03-59-1 TaxID=2607607 RepID=UPI001493D451|nr:restriction endonuclease subunit S [Vibrio sp. 03-59-1]NOH83869.1 type I restriction endonuclease subunit S [Vibrio sp. 03-59-1]
MSQVIPDGWVKTSLSEVVTVNPKHKDLEDQVAGFVPMALAPTDFNGTLNYEERQWDKIKKGYTHFATGDVIFAKVTPCFENGKAAIVKELPNDIGAGSTEFYVLRPAIKDISVNYIFAVIKSYDFLQTGAENMTGAVGLRRVPKKFVEDYKINLPPLAEQKIIADKLDELLAQVESTKARLDAIPAILKSFRQSVLSAAVSGKLTEELTSQSKKLSDVASFQNGFAFKSGWFTKLDKWQVIKLGNIRDGHLFIENSPAYVSDDIANDFLKFSPKKGDTLISMTGTRFKKDYGFGCLVGDEEDILINQRVGRLVPTRTEIDPAFLNIFIRSNLFRDQFFEGETGGVNQGNVGSKHIMSVRIEVPKLSQQTEIVRRVEELFTFADKVGVQVNLAQDRVNNLTQSILAKVFRGELTADWRAANPELITGENSAEALLKRIKAEREALALASKAAKKKPSNKIRAKKVVTKESHSATINRNLSPVQSLIADGVAHNPQDIFNKLTPDLSLTEVFNEISELIRDNKIEEKTVDGITGFFIK